MDDDAELLLIRIFIGSTFGDEIEYARVAILENELIKALERSKTGRYDGPRWGLNQCEMLLHGDADAMFEAVKQLLGDYPDPVTTIRYYTKNETEEGTQVQL